MSLDRRSRLKGIGQVLAKHQIYESLDLGLPSLQLCDPNCLIVFSYRIWLCRPRDQQTQPCPDSTRVRPAQMLKPTNHWEERRQYGQGGPETWGHKARPALWYSTQTVQKSTRDQAGLRRRALEYRGLRRKLSISPCLSDAKMTTVLHSHIFW